MSSPHLSRPVPVVVASGVPYVRGANRFQTLNVYLPATSDTSALIGTPVTGLPGLERGPEPGAQPDPPRYLVHVHGGAWRDPHLNARSVEPTVAHAFTGTTSATPALLGVVSLNYTLSPFPTHPTEPHDPATGPHRDPAREAVHPGHVGDVLHGLDLLRSLGLTGGSYLLSGHSAGACIAAQAVLQSPAHHGITTVGEVPRPAALLGLNGLYDLPGLIDGLGPSHEHLRGEYEMLLGQAFGVDQSRWPAASPALFDPGVVTGRVQAGRAPRLVVLDQSSQDQLVPLNQLERLTTNLRRVSGLRVVRGHRCTGRHAVPWEDGLMMWEGVADTLQLLQQPGSAVPVAAPTWEHP
ncbi:alpha/beta hydrolase [Kineococcus sp. GCM10028916]|uniref:alpha/beta hydrolase n=1 Tax=Kineococcus sp. GCM10028916 TaxID=3273394 RepID=UPI00362EF1FF